MALMLTGTAASNAASTTVHANGYLMLSTDTGQLCIADGSHTFATLPAGFVLVSLAYLNGSPTTTTQTLGDNSTKIATTAFVLANAGGGGGSPGGSNTQVQFNNSGSFAGSSAFTFNSSTGNLTPQGILFTQAGPGAAGNISFGTGYGAPALTLYDGGSGGRYGWGLQASEMQFFIPTSAQFSFNAGGDLQTSGTNEIVRITGAGLFAINGNSGPARVVINDISGGNNTGISFSINGVASWASAAYIPTGTNPSFVFYNNITATNSLFINGDTNNVGIGLTTPVNKLDVVGTIGCYHIVGTGSAPTIAVGAGAGAGGSASIAGTDTSFTVTINTGTLPTGTGATVATITFANSYANAPRPNGAPCPQNAITALLSGATMVFLTTTTMTVVINSGATALTASSTYVFTISLTG